MRDILFLSSVNPNGPTGGLVPGSGSLVPIFDNSIVNGASSSSTTTQIAARGSNYEVLSVCEGAYQPSNPPVSLTVDASGSPFPGIQNTQQSALGQAMSPTTMEKPEGCRHIVG